MKKKFVLLISGRGSNMQAIVQQCQHHPYIDIVAVLSHVPDSAGLAWAAERGIPTIALLHRDYASREAYDQALLAALAPYQPDYIVLAGFMRILSPIVVQAYPNRIVNIHPSLLPSFTGLHTHERVLEQGCRVHGCTVHFVTPELDVGPIIAQGVVPVLAGDTPDSLAHRVLGVEHQIYPAVIRYLAQDRLRLNDQGQVDYEDASPALFLHPCLQAGVSS